MVCVYGLYGWIVFGYMYELCLWIIWVYVWIVWIYVWTSGLDPLQGPVQQTSGLTPP